MAEAGFVPSDSLDTNAASTDYDISTSEGVAQLIAVAVYESSVILHSIITELTLASMDGCVTLFVFSRMLMTIRRRRWDLRHDRVQESGGVGSESEPAGESKL